MLRSIQARSGLDAIRYPAVDTGGWSSSRRVRISPVALGQPQWLGRSFPVSLTMEQAPNRPDINPDMPVSRQQILVNGPFPAGIQPALYTQRRIAPVRWVRR